MGNETSTSKKEESSYLEIYQQLINMGFNEELSLEAASIHGNNINKCISHIESKDIQINNNIKSEEKKDIETASRRKTNKQLHTNLKHMVITDTKAKDLRDSYAQQKFREKFPVDEKKYKHCSHRFPLSIAAFLNSQTLMDRLVRTEQLKKLCNQQINFELVPIAENMVDHKETDNMLKKKFNIMLYKFKNHEQYNYLLKTNPTQLEWKMRYDGLLMIMLKGFDLKRAKDQASMVQKLRFPHRYTAVARLFYRCFQDEKGFDVWNDDQNSSEFRKYLHSKIHNDEKLYVMDAEADSKSNINEDDIDNEESTSASTSRSVIEHIDSDNDECFGEDDKGRELYIGSKGKLYYLTNAGHNRVYLKLDDDDEKVGMINDVSKDVCIGIDHKGNIFYEGCKKGIYYKTQSGNKVYVKDVEHIEMLQYTKYGQIDKRCKAYKMMNSKVNEQIDNMKAEDVCVGMDDKGRKLYEGSKGGLYYRTTAGNKVYRKK